MARGRKTRLNRTAVNIGTALGKVAAKVDRFNKQRSEIASEIGQLIAAAERMRRDLGGKIAATRSAAARPRTLSAEARERIADAQRKRWAKVRASKK